MQRHEMVDGWIAALGTTDAAIAQRKLAHLLAELAAGRAPDAAAQGASSPDRVADYVEEGGRGGEEAADGGARPGRDAPHVRRGMAR
jgi:hypothetical protein